MTRPSWSLPLLEGPGLPAAPDFLHPQRRIHALSWLALAAAGIAVATSASAALSAWQERFSAGQQLEAAQQRLSKTRAAPAAAAPAAGQRPSQPDEMRALLGHPWRAVFLGIESASVDEVQWLALEHGNEGSLRLEGLAGDAAAAVRAAEALQAVPGFAEVGLSRIEQPEPQGTGRRFELKARLAGLPARSRP
jgi:hypothetical protein